GRDRKGSWRAWWARRKTTRPASGGGRRGERRAPASAGVAGARFLLLSSRLYGRPRSLTGSARAGRAVGTARPWRALAGSTAGGDSHPAPKELRASGDRRRPRTS